MMIAAERRSAGPADVTRDGTFRPPPLYDLIARDQQAAAESRRRAWWEVRERLGPSTFALVLGLDPWRLYSAILERAAFWIARRAEYRNAR